MKLYLGSQAARTYTFFPCWRQTTQNTHTHVFYYFLSEDIDIP